VAKTSRVLTIAAAVLVGTFCIGGSAAATGRGQYRVDHGDMVNDLRVTPGATFAVTVAAICVPGYATAVRDVPISEKRAVYAEYGVTRHVTGSYEVDHLIPLELGGSNAISNLWPEPNDHPAGYLNSKDRLENRLHLLACTHRIDLVDAQRRIAFDWVAEYHRVLGVWPAPSGAAASLTP
jgi:hypothetical protein